MGISNFLSHVIEPAGRPVDLVDYPGLRIAIDVSTWIHKVCSVFSEMLGDEKHLSKFGRATLIFQNESNPDVDAFVAKCAEVVVERIESFQRATKSKILVVLDGCTPPVKKTEVFDRRQKTKENQKERDRPVDTSDSPDLEKRIKGNRRAGAGEHYPVVVNKMLQLLRGAKIPFLVAPYEADTQLAFLQDAHYVDLVITEDSDLLAYGLQTPVLYRNSVNPEGVFTRGILIRKQDLGAKLFGKPPKFDLTDISDIELACLFCAAGCDYCISLLGVGPAVACKHTRMAFAKEQPLERLLKNLLGTTWNHKLTLEQKNAYREQFLAALLTFRQGLVYDPVSKVCRSLHETDDPLLLEHHPYQELVSNRRRRDMILGKVFPPNIAAYIAEGWVHPKTMELRFDDAPKQVVEDLENYQKDLPLRPKEWTRTVPVAEARPSSLVGNLNATIDVLDSSQDSDQEMLETQDL